MKKKKKQVKKNINEKVVLSFGILLAKSEVISDGAWFNLCSLREYCGYKFIV